jgi:hypothetical protein
MTQGSEYGNNEYCSILVNPDTTYTGPLSIKRFETEHDYDVLTVNGEAYSGDRGPQDIVPRGAITWRSDESVKGHGWRICMKVATTTITTTTPSTTTTITSTTARLIEGLTPEESAVYNPRLASFWDHNVCEKLSTQVGDDHNWNWCGGFKFDCAKSVPVDSSLCSSTVAVLNFTHSFAKIDGCQHAYFAQYVCKSAN